MTVMERVLLINQRCLLQPSLKEDLFAIWSNCSSSYSSLALPHWTLCVCMCASTCQLPCLFSSSVKECLFCFFRCLCCFAAVYRTFFPFARRRSMCALLLPCPLQPTTFNLSLCGIPAVPLQLSLYPDDRCPLTPPLQTVTHFGRHYQTLVCCFKTVASTFWCLFGPNF